MKLLQVLAAALLATGASTACAASLKVGRPAPNFDLVLVDGRHVHLSDLHGQVVLLNYWATWCVPCLTELPLLDSYYRTASERGWPLKVFAVAMEDNLPKSKLKQLFQLMAIPSADKIQGGPFGDIDAVPTSYVIDRYGVLRYAKAGSFDLDLLNKVLVPLMSQPAPTQ